MKRLHTKLFGAMRADYSIYTLYYVYQKKVAYSFDIDGYLVYLDYFYEIYNEVFFYRQLIFTDFLIFKFVILFPSLAPSESARWLCIPVGARSDCLRWNGKHQENSSGKQAHVRRRRS